MIIKKILLTLCCFTAIHTSQGTTVTLFHKLNSPDELTSVQKHGLLSFQTAYEQGLTRASLNRVFKVKLDRRKENDIYFDPTPIVNAEIAFTMPDKNIFVYNAAYRKIGDWPAYNNSKITLIAYLQAVENMKTLQEKYPDKNIALHPNNAEPIIFITQKNRTSTKHRKFESHKVTTYQVEVALPVGKIAPENLIFITQ